MIKPWRPGWLPLGLAASSPGSLGADCLAGAIVAIMLVPQAMAYSLLAGLPPQIGLYGAASAAIIYPFFGTSRYLAVGPVAIVSLLVATGVASLAPASPADALGYAIQLALLVGLIQLALGIGRLGFLVNFVSHAVIAGFTTAAALLIGLSQVKLLLGISLPRTGNAPELIRALTVRLPDTNPTTVILGICSMALLVFFGSGLRSILQRTRLPEKWIVPLTKSAPLVVVVAGSVAVSLMGQSRKTVVAIVGEIPGGLPSFHLPIPHLSAWSELLPTALAITLVGFAESYAVAKALASKRREKIGANRELVALGAANLGAALVGGFPVAGGFSRSVVNFSAGARTRAASLVSGGLLIVTLAFLTPLFHNVPHAVLAAVIVVAIAKLIDFGSLLELWKYSHGDGAAYLVTFLAVLLLGVEAGILAGAAVALALHLWRTSRPHLAVVGRLGETEHYRNVLRHEVRTDPHVLAVRVDESLYFANMAYLEERLLEMVAQRPEVRDLVLINSAVNFIDGSALETLKNLIGELQDAEVTFHMAEVKGPVMERLERSGFRSWLGSGQIFPTTHEALQALGSAD